jgi:hypothetical protein
MKRLPGFRFDAPASGPRRPKAKRAPRPPSERSATMKAKAPEEQTGTTNSRRLDGARPKKHRVDERELHRDAEALRELGVDPFWLLAQAHGAELRVREWLRLNNWPKSDLVYHVHEALADWSTVRAPSVQDALIDLAGMEKDGCAPDALDETRLALKRRRKPGPRSSLSERKRDEDDLDTLERAKRTLRSAAALYRQSPEAVHPSLVKHVREMQRRRLRLERAALPVWAEWTGRRSRDWMRLQREAGEIADRVRKRKRSPDK